ncbi:2-pyrone-4,6-dicarboxylate hydrolase [Alteribacter lacisalsi]|uniref:2-pyrone-4,6-dicarboxylate hydrolase n=1 Tax=Alteribacter lacisalsi TaxID=2045244 RepID=A0A2W0HF56_9BACI|nr:amidohydrolase family protein [Alteribacter lacisalsi]PYZ95552.1 2-pyrone-4,6-dicarboxylate hydrolase [Alteribacter lacisalsi]
MIFDAHLHIIDPNYPLIRNEGYLPAPFTVDNYITAVRGLNVKGGAVVSGSFQGEDQTYLTAVLEKLGPSFKGVTQLPGIVSDREIEALHRSGIRAVRFNIKRGGREQLARLEKTAQRVYGIAGWHTELYIDSRELGELAPVLKRLPAVSVDHLGLSEEGLPDLVRLAAAGVRVKATGFGRVTFDVKRAVQELHRANPEALMFGTDLPSTRAPRPFRKSDVEIIYEALGEKEARRVLYDNGACWYGTEEEKT